MPLATLQQPRINGHAFKIARAMRDWSQLDLAQASGVPQWRIWKIENDVEPVRPDELQKILSALSTG